jgi:hypothetical protein
MSTAVKITRSKNAGITDNLITPRYESHPLIKGALKHRGSDRNSMKKENMSSKYRLYSRRSDVEKCVTAQDWHIFCRLPESYQNLPSYRSREKWSPRQHANIPNHRHTYNPREAGTTPSGHFQPNIIMHDFNQVNVCIHDHIIIILVSKKGG